LIFCSIPCNLRWGLGRTQAPRSKLARGIPEWSSVVAEVLDRLGIEKCSIMAHSAGAPYALAFANQYPGRIHGNVCLLAPWIGEGGMYLTSSCERVLIVTLSWLQMA
jgi:pimeloyl-ACP methyl ester carboxylesterase